MLLALNRRNRSNTSRSPPPPHGGGGVPGIVNRSILTRPPTESLTLGPGRLDDQVGQSLFRIVPLMRCPSLVALAIWAGTGTNSLYNGRLIIC